MKRYAILSCIVLTVVISVVGIAGLAYGTCESGLQQYSYFHKGVVDDGFYPCTCTSDTITPGGCFSPVEQRNYSCRQFIHHYDINERWCSHYYTYCTTTFLPHVPALTSDPDPCPE